jgi:hypothetical protein
MHVFRAIVFSGYEEDDMAKSDKISKIVSISPAFSEEVALKADFNNPELNQQKVRGYVPNQSSRVALKGIFEGLHPTSTKRVHLITGSYGTGKSHFALVLANLVSRPVDDTDLAPFFTKIRQKDESVHRYVHNQCAVSKRFLVVIPEPHWDPRGFNHSLLAALMEALEQERIEFCPPSNFTAAVKRIEDWQATDQEAYEKLNKALLRRAKTIPIIIDRLVKFDDDAYNLFKEAYSEVAHGALFQPLAVADPRKIYEETIKFLRSTGDWQGVFILYDEFSNYLTEMARDPDSIEGQMLQRFAEYCKRTGENQCHLVMIAHQTLKDYAKGYRTQQEWEKIYGRFIRGDYGLTTLSEENEMENMIDSIINQRGEQADEIELLKEVYGHSDLTIAADTVRERDLYPKQDVKWLESVLLRGCYPLHPYATFCLPWLSKNVGQSHRTVFTFFDDPREGGLRHYIDSTSMFTDDDDHLNLYTTDRLIRYFSDAAKGKPDYKPIMLARDEALAICGAHKLSRRIVDAIAVLNIVGHPKLLPTKETIVEALHVPPQITNEIEQLLVELFEKKVLRFRRATQHYELPYRTGEVDAKDAVDGIKDTLRESFNLVNTLNTKYGLVPIEARQYAEKHFVTRKAVREFIFPTHLSNPQTYLERIEKWYSPDRGKYEGDALVLYVVAESAADIANAKNYLENEACQHSHLVVAVPKTTMDFAEAVLEVEAAKRLKAQGLTTESGAVDRDDLNAVLSDAETIVNEGLAAFLSADNFTWYCGGNVTTVKRNGEEGYISEILGHVLGKTPAVRDVATMTPLAGKSKKWLKDRQDAVGMLVGVKGPFPIRKSGGSAVDRILRACLKKTELLKKMSDKGKIEEFQVRGDPPAKSELAEIWQLLRSNIVDPSGKPVEMGQLVRTLLESPYGLSHQLIEILLAAFLRNIKDECVIFSNHIEVTKTGDFSLYSQMPITAENLIWLVSHPDDRAMYYFEVSDVERGHITGIIEMVDPEGEFVADVGLWENSKNSLLGWFGALSRITTSATNFRHPESRDLIELLSDQNRTRDAKQLLKQYLPQALGAEVTEPLSKGDCDKAIAVFTTCFEELANYAQSQELLLVNRLADVFEAGGKTQSDLATAVVKWYNETLIEPQRVHVFTGDEGHLKQAVEHDAPIVDRFLVNLPAKMGLGAYTDWGDSASFELFITKVELAKRAIEQWTPPEPLLPPPVADLPARIAKAISEVKRIFQTLRIPLENQRGILAQLLEEIAE